MRPPEPLAVHGFSSLEDALTDLPRIRAVIARIKQERHPEGFATEEEDDKAFSKILEEIRLGTQVVDYHNTLNRLIHEHQRAAAIAHTAIRAAVCAYDDLTNRTTTAWHAAHHRYVNTVVDGQDAIVTQMEAADRITQHVKNGWPGLVESFYDRYVPADKRITAPQLPDVATDLTLFRETHRACLHRLSFTITGGYPRGFEPDTVPEPQTANGPFDRV